MEVYLVGGAVRDELLGLADASTEKDWVVVGASSQQMLDLGYQQVGRDFPVFLHPETKEEYALARLERKIGEGYKGFEFDTSSKVSLEQDLLRRDLTINAIARDNQGQLIDPYQGQEDLQNGILRHVSEAFAEDPVRILRVARFAARFHGFGFKVAHTTHRFMKQMVASGEVQALTPERVFKELEKSLSYETPSAFFKVLLACDAYRHVFPGLTAPTYDQHSNPFVYLDGLSVSPALKFALWLKDQHSEQIQSLCQQLHCPKHYTTLASLFSQWRKAAFDWCTLDAQQLLEFLLRVDALRREQRFLELLQGYDLLGADTQSLSTLVQQLRSIDIATLDQDNIAKSLHQARLALTQSFLDAT